MPEPNAKSGRGKWALMGFGQGRPVGVQRQMANNQEEECGMPDGGGRRGGSP